MSTKGSSGTGQTLRARRKEWRSRLRKSPPEHFCPDCLSVTFHDQDTCLSCATEAPEAGWPPVSDASDPWLGEVINDRYLITRPLGHGASGAVYRGESLSISRQFAVKIIATDGHKDQAEQVIARLNREIEALSRLRNPHIVSIYEILELRRNFVAAVMDLIEGSTLETLVLDGGALSVSRACALLRQTANGIFGAHQAGMIHRDLKPENIMVERLPVGDDFVHILDFGIVRLTDEPSVNLTHGFIGTPLYASPEQATAKSIDHRSDIYSLGAILFFMLTGEPPFVSDNVYEVLRMHVRKKPPRLSEVLPERNFPPKLEDLLARMLAKDPSQRPSDLSRVIEELDRLSRNQISEADSASPTMAEISSTPKDTHDFPPGSTADPRHRVGTPESGLTTAPSTPKENDFSDRDEHTSSATLQAHGAREPAHTPAFTRTPTPTEASSPEERAASVADSVSISFSSAGNESSAATAIPVSTYRLTSPPDQVLASRRVDDSFVIFDPTAGAIQLFRPNSTTPSTISAGSTDTFSAIAFAPPSSLIVGHDNGTISRIELEHGKSSDLFQDVRRAPISSVAVDDDERCIIAGSKSGRVYMHHHKHTGSSDWKRICSGASVGAVTLNKKADTAVIARQDNTVEVINLATPRVPTSQFRVDAPIRSMAISPDEYLLSAALADGSVALFQILTGRKLYSLPNQEVAVLSIDFSDEAKPVAVCSIEQQVRVLQFEQINSHA